MKFVSRRQAYRCQLRADLYWVAGFFFALQVALAATVDRCLPQVRDGHWASLEKRLLGRLADSPGAKLVVMVGSSRTQLALQGVRLSRQSTQDPSIVFNLGVNGNGPMMETVALYRLLARGIRPDAVLVEINPLFVSESDGRPMEEVMLAYRRLSAREALDLSPYFSKANRLAWPWLREQLLPCKSRRQELQLYCAFDSYKPWARANDPYVVMDDYGWCPIHASVTAEEREAFTRMARLEHGPRLQRFELAPTSIRVLSELFNLCAREGITTAMVSMPEGPSFRALYPPEANDRFQSWVSAFCRQRNLTLVDARDWVPEIEFYDGHHLLPEGARTFTERLGGEFMDQFLERLPSHPVDDVKLARGR
jgi:hypothetical protein